MAQFPQTVKLCSQVGGLVPKKRLPMEPPMGHSTRAAGNDLIGMPYKAPLLALSPNDLYTSVLRDLATTSAAGHMHAGMYNPQTHGMLAAKHVAQQPAHFYGRHLYPLRLAAGPAVLPPSDSSAGAIPQLATQHCSNAEQRHQQQQQQTQAPPETVPPYHTSMGDESNTTPDPPKQLPLINEKRFTCQHCHRSFKYRHVLVNHVLIHTGVKPHQCDYCDQRFTRDHHLKVHIRLHTGERPYHCDFCERKFVQVANLRRHLRTHTGEKPNACTLCDARYADSNQLKTHRYIIHKDPTAAPKTLRRHAPKARPEQSARPSPAAAANPMALYGRKASLLQMYVSSVAAGLGQLRNITRIAEGPYGSKFVVGYGPIVRRPIASMADPLQQVAQPIDGAVPHSDDMSMHSEDYEIDIMGNGSVLDFPQNSAGYRAKPHSDGMSMHSEDYEIGIMGDGSVLDFPQNSAGYDAIEYQRF